MKTASTLELQTNPQPVVSVTDTDVIGRLKAQEKKWRIHKDRAQFLMEVGNAGCFVTGFVGLGVGGWIGGAVGGVGPFAIALAYRLISSAKYKKIERKLNQTRKKLNPKSYFEIILKKERQYLKQDKMHAAGYFNLEDIRHCGKDAFSEMCQLRDKAKEHLPEQQQKVDILEAAQGFVEKCEQKETVLRIVELAEKPMKENLDLLREIVNKEQITESKNTTQKSKSDDRQGR